MTQADKLYGTNEVAALLGISPADVRRAVEDGLARPQRVGNSLVFRESDVAQLDDALDEDADDDACEREDECT